MSDPTHEPDARAPERAPRKMSVAVELAQTREIGAGQIMNVGVIRGAYETEVADEQEVIAVIRAFEAAFGVKPTKSPLSMPTAGPVTPFPRA